MPHVQVFPVEKSENITTLKSNPIKDFNHPCLCKSIKVVTFWGRLVGILPITSDKCGKLKNKCTFKISTGHLVYSYCIQVLYLIYILSAYISRLICGPNKSNGLEWYVMTFGYFITDCHTLISMVAGSWQAKKICKILEKLSFLPGSLGTFQNLEKMLRRYMIGFILTYLFVFLSHLYVGYLRLEHNFGGAFFSCTMLGNLFYYY